MSITTPAIISVARRHLSISGAHDAYLRTLDQFQGDCSAVSVAMNGLPAESVILDVGANIGLTAIIMAATRPDCRIIAFEPLPDNVKFLRQNIQAAELDNIEVMEAAVGDTDGVVRMTNNGPWSVAAALGGVECRVARLDSVIKQPVGFIKIDTEGFEPNVLSGAVDILRRHKPLCLVEFNVWTLLLQRHDPRSFAEAIWGSSDVVGVFHNEIAVRVPDTPLDFLHENLTRHGCLADLMIRPVRDLPPLPTTTQPPRHDGTADTILQRMRHMWRRHVTL